MQIEKRIKTVKLQVKWSFLCAAKEKKENTICDGQKSKIVGGSFQEEMEKKVLLANNWDIHLGYGLNTRFKIDCNSANKRVVNSLAHALRLWMDFDCIFSLSFFL